MLDDLDVPFVLEVSEQFRVTDLPAGIGGEQFEELAEERGPRKCNTVKSPNEMLSNHRAFLTLA